MKNTVEICQKDISNKSDEINVVSREAIPPIYSIFKEGKEHFLGQVRDFQWHEALKNFLPSSAGTSFSWVRLKAEEMLMPHAHPIQTMIIVTKGTGKLTGQKNQILNEGDVVIVPPGCAHGFEGGKENGFDALSVQFEGGLYSHPEQPRVEFTEETFTLQTLIDYNQKRLREFGNADLFKLVQNGTLDDPVKRQVFLGAFQIWVEGNQTLMFSRQASCRDPYYKTMFSQHMSEEIGHDDLYNNRADKSESDFKDTGMEAVTTWFVHQMFMLDNIEKTAMIHLVIESASDVYHKTVGPYLTKYINDEYFSAHVADCDHITMGIKLLEGYNAKVYRRLFTIVKESWDMLHCMIDRVTYLVNRA